MKLTEKLKAAGAHLGINLIIFSLLLFVLLKLWYPAPFFTASGGLQGLKIVALVDIVLGPVLTLVIFNSAKPRKELLTDVSMIACIQIAAFIWGTWTVYIQRPVQIAFWEDRFFSVPAASLAPQGKTAADLKQFGDTLPVYVYVDREISEERSDEIFKAMDDTGGLPPFEIVQLQQPYRERMQDIAEHSIDIETVREKYPDIDRQLKTLLFEKNLSEADAKEFLYVKLESKYHNTVIVFNSDGDILGFLDAPYKKDV